MSTVKMSVHRGLSELKLYENKIDSAFRGAFVVANKQSNGTLGGKSIAEVKETIKANFDSVVALIENKKRIKDAIVKSNAKTEVTIGSKKMTVAEAIERKNSIQTDREFLSTLQSQFANENRKVEMANEQLSAKLEPFLVATLGDGKRDVAQVEALTKTFRENNEFVLIDPNKIQDYIKKLENEINSFESQVDYTLSEINATTFIDVDLVD